jgi:predicted DNA-binding transcriptional regulator YafY
MVKNMNSSHDKITFRHIDILRRLNENWEPTMQEIADEYGVSLRTVQKDIYERLCMFPIEKREDKRLRFTSGFNLGYSSLNIEEILLLDLALSQVKHLSDESGEISQNIFKKMITKNFFNPLHIKAELYEEIDMDSFLIKELTEAIKSRELSSLEYKNRNVVVKPYKIANFDGIWYLFAEDKEDAKIKTYMLAQIKKATLLNQKFKEDRDIDKVLEGVHSAWFDDGSSFDVTLKIHREIAHFFKLKKYLSSQKILKELSDGSLHVSFNISNDEDLDNLIKSWLPHIEVISPISFQKRIIDELSQYILNSKRSISI